MAGAQKGGRHRSKLSKGKKQKKSGRKRKARRKPGSEEELQGLVGILKSSVPDSNYAATITETIHFLLLVQNLTLAEELFTAYNLMCESIEESKKDRMENTRKEKIEATLLKHSCGDHDELTNILVDLPVEKEIDTLSCARLAKSIFDSFDFLHTNSST